MNFKIFDDEFDESKEEYQKEIEELSKDVILPQKKEEWNKFVTRALIDTRSYYIFIYSLNVMHNLDDTSLKALYSKDEFYNQALLKAMSFMPDKTFIETAIMIVGKFHKDGKNLALSQGVTLPKEEQKEEKKDEKAQQTDKNLSNGKKLETKTAIKINPMIKKNKK